MPELTLKQFKSLAEIADSVSIFGVDMAMDIHDHRWTVRWEGSFPGGGLFDGTYIDDEKMVRVRLDVHGNGGFSAADLEWVHNDFNEDCDCAYCRKEREYEDRE